MVRAGLVPDRRSRFNTLRELSRLLPPLSIYTRTARVPGVKVYRDQEVKSEGAASRVINTSRSNSAGLQTDLVCVYSMLACIILTVLLLTMYVFNLLWYPRLEVVAVRMVV